MKTATISFFATLLPLLLIDGAYLFGISSSFYHRHIGHLMAPSPTFLPAILFYLVYAVGIVVFVVLPAIRGGQGIGHSWIMGAFLGIVAYGAYDMTNQATLRDWPVIVSVVDMAWGAFLTGTVSLIAVWVSRMFV
ncbi:MAG: DUF2177 family protein [Candidatus Paceibacterota bacterium]|jgi:uncharacterized membrane protein